MGSCPQGHGPRNQVLSLAYLDKHVRRVTFGPQNSSELIVSMSSGCSVEFQLRARQCASLIRLDHGCILVMDGLAQSEYVHRTVSELQGPRVNLTYRWVTQHIASCPLSGVMCCAMLTFVQGLAEPGPHAGATEETKGAIFWLMVFHLSIGVCFLWEHARIEHWRKSAHSGHCSTRLAACSSPWVPPAGLGEGVGDCRGAPVTPKRCSFWFP